MFDGLCELLRIRGKLSDGRSWMGDMWLTEGAERELCATTILKDEDRSRCAVCGFTLWTPLVSLGVSDIGLYDDARFPGRLIVSARDHYDQFDDIPGDYMAAFIGDVQAVARVLRKLPDVERVNVSILGNKESHVHAHVIPRRWTDRNFGKSPWEDAAEFEPLQPSQKGELVDLLRSLL